MKNKSFLVLMLALLSTLTVPLSIRAQGTAFTYQGRLNNGANPANGLYDFQFTLYDGSSDPLAVVSVTNTLIAVPVSNGIFTVSLDFGDPDSLAIFTGQEIWLGIAMRTNNPASNYTQLLPRQKFTATPYAITAANLGGTLSSNSFSGVYGSAVTLNNSANHFSGSFTGSVSGVLTGNGANVTNVNAAKLGGLSLSSFWQTGGNTGTSPGVNILGTLDNQPLELWVNGGRAFKIIPTSGTANIIGGSIVNTFDPGIVGATIAGGGGSFQGFTRANYVRADFTSIGGGGGNVASNVFTTVAGGFRNSASGIGAFVGGGGYDSNEFFYIPNLIGNSASGTAATISGGIGNTASGKYAVVGGGFGNTASGYGSSVGGGGITGENLSFGINVYGNTASGVSSTVGGGVGNSATDYYTTVAGGNRNVASNRGATVCGGQSNIASGIGSFVGGGGVVSGISGGNIASGDAATVCGGFENVAAGDHSFAAGWGAGALHVGSFVWSDGTKIISSTGNYQFIVNAIGGVGIGTNAPAGRLHVASEDGKPQLQLTQNGSSDYARLRMNVLGSPSWEMDVSPGATPAISWWTGTLKMNLDYNGNLTTVGTVNGSSDRNVKEHFSPVSARDVLEKVSSLPITEWNYITDGETLRHIGPMAQDFYAAFSLGTDDKHISMVDADGVALAAIQGLNQKLEQKETEITELKQRLEALERIVRGQKSN